MRNTCRAESSATRSISLTCDTPITGCYDLLLCLLPRAERLVSGGYHEPPGSSPEQARRRQRHYQARADRSGRPRPGAHQGNRRTRTKDKNQKDVISTRGRYVWGGRRSRHPELFMRKAGEVSRSWPSDAVTNSLVAYCGMTGRLRSLLPSGIRLPFRSANYGNTKVGRWIGRHMQPAAGLGQFMMRS